MTRSTRSSTVTSTRASRSAQSQRETKDDAGSTSGATKQRGLRSSPRSASRRSRDQGKSKQNGRNSDSEEETSSEEDEKPVRATRGTPNRKRPRDADSPSPRKSKVAKSAVNGATENGVVDSSDDDASESDRRKSTSSNGNKQGKTNSKSPKKGKDGKDKNETPTKTSKKQEEAETESMRSTTDDEVILTGFSRGSKRKALASLNAMKDDESEEDLEEIMDSEDDVEEISSATDIEDEEDDDEEDTENEDEVQVIEFSAEKARKGITSVGKYTISKDITSKEMEKLLKTMKREYEDLVQQKDEEIERLRNEVKHKAHQMESMSDLLEENMELEARISALMVTPEDEKVQRLRNEIKYKDQQLESMNDLMTQNMELEARISAILSDSEVYKREVEDAKEKKTKSPEKKKEEKQIKKIVEETMFTEEAAGREKRLKSEDKDNTSDDKEKLLPTVTNGDSDSDIEEITEEEAKSEIKKKKRDKSTEKVKEESDSEPMNRRSSITKNKHDTSVDEVAEEDTPEPKNKRPRRGRKAKAVKEEESEKIEALFVSDDEEDEADKEEKTRRKSRRKKGEQKADEDKEKDDSKETDTKEADKDKEEDSPDKGRHNIRKLMADKKLKEETKAAAKEEKERLERVAKLKEKHQILSHTDPKTKQPVYTKMVLAFKKDEKTPLVEVNTKILKKLKPHQVDAVEFLWDSVIETTDRLKDGHPGSGCIIAHCMGLGKTLSVISFVHTMLTHKMLKLKTCLVVCPLNTILNWKFEWSKWLDKKDRLPTFEMASAKDNQSRMTLLQKWQKEGGVMIMGYSLFRILATSTTKSKKRKKIFDESLVDPGADLIVCDEGHVLKNDASAISKCMNKIRSKRRIVLTGTPLQNNLIEYHCMVAFVKPNLLGTRKEFSNRFVNPITNGQHADSTAHDVKVMKRRAHVLHKMLSGCVQRRDYSALTKFLPPKYEYILSIRLSPLQIKLYEKYLEKSRSNNNAAFRGTSLFSDYQALMRIWTHPWVLKMDEIRQEKKITYNEDDDDELESFLTSDTSEEEEEEDEETSQTDEEPSEQESENQNGTEEDDEEDEEQQRPLRRSRRSATAKDTKIKDKDNQKNKTKGKKEQKDTDSDSDLEEILPDGTTRKAKVVAGEVIKHWQTSSRRKGPDEETPDIKKSEDQWWTEYVSDEHKTMLEQSGKLVLLMDILRMAEGLGDKVLVFSQSLLSLDLIEDFLAYKNEEAEKLREGKKGKSASSIPLWKKDEDYCRMDGSTSAQNRTKATSIFNCIKNKRMRLFLISTKAGGLGINLDSANRVIIFDASWNPSHDIQSIFRAYRFGQDKDVFIYRFLAQGTMEEKIYERQVTKETLSQRVIDEHQLDRHFTASDLQELYNFQPDRLDDPDRKEKPTPKVPKDVILAELLSERKEWVVGYHEHDSLLEKRPDEDLSEEERKAAWDDYEKEKQGFMYHYRQQQQSVATYNYNYRPQITNYLSIPKIATPVATMAGQTSRISIPASALSFMPPPTGFSSEQAKLNFQLSQLPRVVQEILKYNPDITPVELQTRLRAFMGMHSRYSNVPGFAMGNQPLVGQPNVTEASATSSETSTANLAKAAAAAVFTTPSTSTWPTTVTGSASPSPAQLSQAIVAGLASAATGAMPSRLPLPGRVPANQK